MTARYAQRDDTCTVDCGHCKGQPPSALDRLRAMEAEADHARARARQGWPTSSDVDTQAAAVVVLTGALRAVLAELDKVKDVPERSAWIHRDRLLAQIEGAW